MQLFSWTISYRTAFTFFCLLVIPCFCVQAQSVSASSDTPSINQTSQQKAVSPLVVSHNAKDKPAPAHKAEAPARSREPRIRLAHPAPTLDITVSPDKLAAIADLPDEEELAYAPQSFRATAYSLRGRTRSGQYVRRGVVAADPRLLPLGTKVELKAGNYSGVYTVLDTGGVIKGGIIDIWMPSSSEARRFGRQRVKLVVRSYPRGRTPNKTKKAPR